MDKLKEKKWVFPLIYISLLLCSGVIIYYIYRDNATHFYESFTINKRYLYLLTLSITCFLYIGRKKNSMLTIGCIIIIG